MITVGLIVMSLPVSIHLRGRGSRSAEAESRVQAAYDELAVFGRMRALFDRLAAGG
jgi:hypothetical protein